MSSSTALVDKHSFSKTEEEELGLFSDISTGSRGLTRQDCKMTWAEALTGFETDQETANENQTDSSCSEAKKQQMPMVELR